MMSPPLCPAQAGFKKDCKTDISDRRKVLYFPEEKMVLTYAELMNKPWLVCLWSEVCQVFLVQFKDNEEP